MLYSFILVLRYHVSSLTHPDASVYHYSAQPQSVLLSVRLSYQMISALCGPELLGGDDTDLGCGEVRGACWNPSPGPLLWDRLPWALSREERGGKRSISNLL